MRCVSRCRSELYETFKEDSSFAHQKKGLLMKTLTIRSCDRSTLRYFFSPASVAVVGATDRAGSVGGTVLKNLQTGTYKGRVYAVNPDRAEVFGLRCHASIGAVPEAVDLVVVVTPANTVPGIVSECVRAEAKSVVVISAGFKEKGPE